MVIRLIGCIGVAIALSLSGMQTAKFFEEFFSGFSRDDFAQFLQGGAADIGNAAEFVQEFLRGARADAGDAVESGFGLARGTALAVEGYGEAMRFVADLLDEMKDRRMMFENEGLIFLSEDVQNFFFFGDAGHGLVDDLQRIERLRGGVKLADAAVN